MTSVGYIRSFIGWIKIEEKDGVIVSVDFLEDSKPKKVFSESKTIKECKKQLDEYFKGRRKKFDLKVMISGTDFQKKVLTVTGKIKYGETLSYSQVAAMVNKPKAFRAVGLVLKQNKVPLLIPCHRVIGKDGSLKGFAKKIQIKEKLLKFENKNKKRGTIED